MVMDKRQIYETIIQNIPVGFSLVDKDGIITEFNPAAEKITGYSRDEVIGKPHLDLPHIDGGGDSCPFIEHVLNRKERIIAAEVTIKNKSGEHVTAVVTGCPLFDDAGELSGAVELFRDITDAKRQERERKNILSMFAHDMKNPIAAAGGFLSRLISEKAGPLSSKVTILNSCRGQRAGHAPTLGSSLWTGWLEYFKRMKSGLQHEQDVMLTPRLLCGARNSLVAGMKVDDFCRGPFFPVL
jgi:PAS domain S-box-containing protein